MIAVMEEHEQTTTDNVPRWKAAGRPFLLTRDELLEELHRAGELVTEWQLKSWETYGILPQPERRTPPGAPTHTARVLYPVAMLPVIRTLVHRLRHGVSRKDLKRAMPALIDYWQAQSDERILRSLGGPHDDVRVLGGSAQAGPATGSSPSPAALTSRQAAALWPRISRALQRAAWTYAQRFARYQGTPVVRATLVLEMADGSKEHVPITPPPNQQAGSE